MQARKQHFVKAGLNQKDLQRKNGPTSQSTTDCIS